MWRTHTNSSESPVAASRSLITVVPIQKPLYWKWNALRGRTFELWEFYLSRKKWLLLPTGPRWRVLVFATTFEPSESDWTVPVFSLLLPVISANKSVIFRGGWALWDAPSFCLPPPPSAPLHPEGCHQHAHVYWSFCVERWVKNLSTCVQLPQSVPRGPRINWSCLKLFPFICFYSFYDYYYCYYYYIFQGPFSFLAFTPFCFLHTIRSGVFFFLLFFSFMLCKTSRVRDWLCFRRRRSREQKSEADLSRPFLQKLLWKRKK